MTSPGRLLPALVCQTTSESLQTAGQSAASTQTAPAIEPVSERNVSTRVQDPADQMPNVKLLTTTQYADVPLDTMEIHSENVVEFLRLQPHCDQQRSLIRVTRHPVAPTLSAGPGPEPEPVLASPATSET